MISYSAVRKIPWCIDNYTTCTIQIIHTSQDWFNASHERPFSRSVLKSSVSKAAHQPGLFYSYDPSSTRTEQILWQLREGGKRERAGDRQGERRRGGKSEERVPRERVPVLHSSKSPHACQWGDSPAVTAAAVVEQSSRRGRCWHCTTIVLHTHITHSSQRKPEYWGKTWRKSYK